MAKQYPASNEINAGDPFSTLDANKIRNDALYLGEHSTREDTEDNNVTLGEMLETYMKDVAPELLGTDKIRVPYSAQRPPTLVIAGYICKATDHVDLASSHSGGAGTYYIHAKRTDGSNSFSLVIRGSQTEGPNERVIGEFVWDGSAISTVIGYEYNIPKDGIIKAWGSINSAGTINDSYGIDTVTRTGTGTFVITWVTDFANANYAVTLGLITSNLRLIRASSKAVGSITVSIQSTSGSLENESFDIMAIGDQ